MHYSTKNPGSATDGRPSGYNHLYRFTPEAFSEGKFINRLFHRLPLLTYFCVSFFLCPICRADTAPQKPNGVDPAFYQYDQRTPFTATQAPAGYWQGISITRVTYPSPVVTPFPANNLVTAYLFLPHSPGPHPVMLVLHEWLPNNLNNAYDIAGALAKAQIAALVMVEPYSLQRRPLPRSKDGELVTGNVPEMVAGIRQCILDARRGLDWLSTQPEIDPKRMGVTGISLGGILAPLLAGADSRAHIVVAIDGGADVADVIWSSPFMRGLHPELKRRGYTRQSVHAAMAPVEAPNWLHNFDPKNGLLFNGRYDVFIKPQQARELSQAMGGAPIVWLDTGHYGLAFSMKSLNDTGVRFLQGHFFADAPPFTTPDSLPSRTIKFGLLIGGHEGVSPALAYQILDFDKAGRYSLDGQLTLHGLAGGLSVRLTPTASVGLELPIFHGPIKPKPYLLLHIVL